MLNKIPTNFKTKPYTIAEFLEALGGKLSKKMFAYIRDTLHLIPPPIKTSDGNGITALYPECAVKHMQRILKKKAKGATFAEIKEEFKEDTQRVFAETNSLKIQYKIQLNAKRSFSILLASSLKTGNHPAFNFKSNDKRVDLETEIEKIKSEFKKDASKLDNVTIEALNEFRIKLDELEKLEKEKELSKLVRRMIESA